MNILLIDTATGYELAAASGALDFDAGGHTGLRHSGNLFARIDAALQGAGISVNDIDLVAVGTGPGSFTGIRIAVTTARMLAQVCAVPLLGLPTTMLHAAGVPAGNGDFVLTAYDAKKNRVFGALYQRRDGLLEEVVVPEITPPNSFFRRSPRAPRCMPQVTAAHSMPGCVTAHNSGVHIEPRTVIDAGAVLNWQEPWPIAP